MTGARGEILGRGLAAIAFVAASTLACSDDDPTGDAGTSPDADNGGGGAEVACAITSPTIWTAPAWETNAEAALALRDRLALLTGDGLLRGAETGAVAVTRADLDAVYGAGTPSLAGVSSPYLSGLVGDAFDELLAATAAGPRELVDATGQWSPGPHGGVWSTRTRAYNEGGIEVRMIVNMGLFGAGFYNYAVGLTTGTIDEATVDALAAAFGANPGLNPGRSDDAVAANQNRNSANYVYRMGLYGRARQALIAAKAYAASPGCVAERDLAIRSFFRAWEQGLIARFVYYSNAGAKGVANATTPEALATALHEQAEGIGLAIGFYQLPAAAAGPMQGVARGMTDELIANALGVLRVNVAGSLGTAALGSFVADPLAYAAAVRAAEAVVALAFGLGEAELASYRMPTDG